MACLQIMGIFYSTEMLNKWFESLSVFFPQNLTVLLLTYHAKQGWIQKHCVSFLFLPLVWKILYIIIFKCWCFRLRFRYSTNKSWFFSNRTPDMSHMMVLQSFSGQNCLSSLNLSSHERSSKPLIIFVPFCAPDSSKVGTALHVRRSILRLNYILTCMR